MSSVMKDLSLDSFVIKNAIGNPFEPWLLSSLCQQLALIRMGQAVVCRVSTVSLHTFPSPKARGTYLTHFL